MSVFDHLANSLLSAVMRAESAYTASELKEIAVLGEACRASAERFADMPDDDLDGFLELRTNANAYLQALQQILLKPKR